MIATHLRKRKASHIDEQHPARERFRNALDQIPRSAAQQEKNRLARPIVADRAQDLEQGRHPLDFVDDHQTVAAAQYGLRRLGERLPRRGNLEIENPG